MIASIKIKLLEALKNKFGICIKSVVIESFLNKQYRVIKGTIRKEPDYDDAYCLALALHSTNVFDVGANVGQSAILILYSETIQRIVCIDPNPQALAIAAENLILNNLSQKAIFIRAFASEKSNQEIEFWTIGDGAAGSMLSTHAKTAKSTGSSYYVPTVTLDYLSEYYDLTPDYVKIDVEGAESLGLDGARKIASKENCKILLRCIHLPNCQ